MKKFYKKAELLEKEEGFQIGLDGKPVKTPLGNLLFVAQENLALAVVEEWNNQHENIVPDTMPLTQFLTTHIDKTIGQQESIYQILRPYIHGDTLLYFNEEDEELYEMQIKNWQPVLEKFGKDFGVSYQIQKTIFPDNQNDEVVAVWENLFTKLSDEELTFFQMSVSLTSSPILSLYFLKQEMNPKTVFNLTLLEEFFQNEKWGKDYLAEEKQNRLMQELQNLERFLKLYRA